MTEDERVTRHALVTYAAAGTVYCALLFGAYSLGRTVESQATLDAYETAEYYRAIYVRCEAVSTQTLAYVGEVDAELHAQLLWLPAPTLTEINQ